MGLPINTVELSLWSLTFLYSYSFHSYSFYSYYFPMPGRNDPSLQLDEEGKYFLNRQITEQYEAEILYGGSPMSNNTLKSIVSGLRDENRELYLEARNLKEIIMDLRRIIQEREEQIQKLQMRIHELENQGA